MVLVVVMVALNGRAGHAVARQVGHRTVHYGGQVAGRAATAAGQREQRPGSGQAAQQTAVQPMLARIQERGVFAQLWRHHYVTLKLATVHLKAVLFLILVNHAGQEVDQFLANGDKVRDRKRQTDRKRTERKGPP